MLIDQYDDFCDIGWHFPKIIEVIEYAFENRIRILGVDILLINNGVPEVDPRSWYADKAMVEIYEKNTDYILEVIKNFINQTNAIEPYKNAIYSIGPLDYLKELY